MHAMLDNIPANVREALQNASRKVLVGKTDTLFLEGQPVDGLYILSQGFLKVTRLSVDGNQQLIEILCSGEMVGELALYDDEPRSATATALVDSHLAFIPKANLFKTADEHPIIYRALLKALSNRLRETNHSFARNQFLPVSGQVAAVLIRMAHAMGNRQQDHIIIQDSLTHKEIASMIGAARENVTRTISKFKQEGMIDTSKNTIILKDIKQLEELALI